MNKRLPPNLFTTFTIGLMTLISPFATYAESYTFSGGKQSLAQTIASAVLVKAYSKVNIQVTPVFLTLKESLRRSNSGETDGELARISSITKFSPNLQQVPVSVISIQAIAFSKNKNLNIKNWNDLKDHKFTIVKGVKFIETATKDLDRTFVDTIKEAIEQLHQNKTEVIVIPKLASINLIYQKKYHNIKAVSSSLQTHKLYHFVHKKNHRLIAVITPVLEEMKNSGEIAHIKKSQLMKATQVFTH